MIWLIHIQYSWSIVCNGLVQINYMEKKKQFMKKNILKTVPLKDLPEREILHSFNAVNDASGLCSTKHWAHPLVFLGRALQRNSLRKQKFSIMLQMTAGTWCFSTNVKTLIFLICNWLWINCWAVRVEVWSFIYNPKYSTELISKVLNNYLTFMYSVWLDHIPCRWSYQELLCPSMVELPQQKMLSCLETHF